MPILLEESVPTRLGALLSDHQVKSVQRRGWAGIKNGKLLALAAAEFDILLSADRGIEHQQNLATLPIAVLVVVAQSNRMTHLAPLVPAILEAIREVKPRTLRRVP